MVSAPALRRLYPSLREHREVEARTLRLLRESLDPGYVGPAGVRAPALQYMQKHIFSITFLAIYRALGIAGERRILYGLINHAIRGIVTAADNLLDDEYKEMLPLRFAGRGVRFKSVMHLLLFERLLFQAVDQGVQEGLIPSADREAVTRRVFDAMVPIGAQEASEEGGVGEILAPEEILHSVHRYKGGELLRSAFLVPRLVERDLAAALDKAEQGVHGLGLALQVIDDITDFEEDIRDRRHNYLVSTVFHDGGAEERAALQRRLQGAGAGPPIESVCGRSLSRVMGRAFALATAGVCLLEEAGFWLKREQAVGLIRELFRLRKLGHLLAYLPDEAGVAAGQR